MQLATSQSTSQLNEALQVEASFSFNFNREEAIKHVSEVAAKAAKEGTTALLTKVANRLESTAKTAKALALRADQDLKKIAQGTIDAGFATKCALRDRFEANLEREDEVVEAVTYAAAQRTVKLAKQAKWKALRVVARELQDNVRPTLKTRWVSPWQAHDEGVRNLLEKCYQLEPKALTAQLDTAPQLPSVEFGELPESVVDSEQLPSIQVSEECSQDGTPQAQPSSASVTNLSQLLIEDVRNNPLTTK